ncbi:MAG: hypothetical protein KDC34_14855 [Saprospiraceae bacterium]|nr:hypothetical protein [Saprospiraceae bacterium]
MNSYFIPVLILLLLPVLSEAQEIRTNEKGEKIIVYQDGSWRYFNSNDDTLFGSDGTVYEQELIPTDPKEREAYMEEKDKEGAMLLANQASLEAGRYEDAYDRARQARMAVAAELAELKGLGNSVDPQAVKDLESDLAEALKNEETAKTEMDKASDLAMLTEEMIEMNRKKRAKALERYETMYNGLYGTEEPVVVSQPKPAPTGGPVRATDASAFTAYDPELDVMVNPPDPDCFLTFDGVDEFSGKKRRDTQMKVFFTATRDELRPYLNGKEYVVCKGQLTSLSGGLLFLSLEFTIASKTAQQSFGGLQKGSLMTIKLLNGESVRMQNSKSDYGTYNAVEESFTFRGQYMIDPGMEKMLRDGEVDKIRVNWGAGYEDYELYELDFFSDMLRCLFDD